MGFCLIGGTISSQGLDTVRGSEPLCDHLLLDVPSTTPLTRTN